MNLLSIYLTNLFGLILAFMLLLNNRWRFRVHTQENRYLGYLLFITIVSCIVDPFATTALGKPGPINHALVMVGNSWLFFANTAFCYVNVQLFFEYLHYELATWQQRVLNGAMLFELFLLIGNFFTPLIFRVDANNLYYREIGYFVYIFIGYSIFLNAIFLYFRKKKQGKILKDYPLFELILPFTAGITVQTIFYGTSLIWPCATVSLMALVSSLQNNLIFHDELTGLYNRFYWDYLKRKLEVTAGYAHNDSAVLFIDMNYFKSINDTYGHLEGDEALIAMAGILHRTSKTAGHIIRYAGDEFVILFKPEEVKNIEKYIENIQIQLAEYNRTSQKPYELSASFGYCIDNLAEKTSDELLQEADKMMYRDKMKCHDAILC